MILLITIATFITTLAGGAFVLKFHQQRYLVLGFSAGAVLGVAFFDLIPTAFSLSAIKYGIHPMATLIALGFIAYLILDQLIVHLSLQRTGIPGNFRGHMAAFSLTIHSLLDGISIGLAFQVSVSIGGFVAMAVLVHDFADGINTINVILKEDGKKNSAIRWLVYNALAPVVGAYSTYFYHLPQEKLGLLLALMAGFFVYIGASSFLPDSRANSPILPAALLTILGFAVIYFAVNFSGI